MPENMKKSNLYINAIDTALQANLFDGSKRDEIKAFLLHSLDNAIITIKTFPKQKTIYSPNSYQRELGIIASGKILVEKGDGILLNILEEKDCFGVAALFGDTGKYVATLRSASETVVVFLPMPVIEDIFRQHSQVAVNYIEFLSSRIHFLNHKIDSFTSPATTDALLDYINTQSFQAGKTTFSLPIPVSKLADMLHIGRTSLYRSFKILEQQGIIKKEGKSITLFKAGQTIL